MKKGSDIALSFPGLFVVHHNKPGSHVETHHHDEHHLILPLRGEVRLKTEGSEITFGPGRMAYIPSGLDHEFLSTNDKEGERLIALIDAALWKRNEGGAFPFLLLPQQQFLKEVLFQLLLAPKSRAVRELTLCFVSVLSEALASAQDLRSTEGIAHLLGRAQDSRIKSAIEILEGSYRDEIDMKSLAKKSGLSDRNLTRLFVQEIGLGPKQVLIRLRLEEAHRLLSEEKISVTEACYRSGHNSLSRFIQSFRENFGRLPSEV